MPYQEAVCSFASYSWQNTFITIIHLISKASDLTMPLSPMFNGSNINRYYGTIVIGAREEAAYPSKLEPMDSIHYYLASPLKLIHKVMV
jgi:hypothetical protein